MALTTSSGYHHDFVYTTMDRLICKICHLPSRDPYLSVCCGHLFCKSCLDNVKKASGIANTCPVCRDEKFVTFPNKAVDREIKSLHIYCTNKEKGCEWQGELNDISDHLGNSDGCLFEEVKCSNECGKMIQRRYLTSHVETECPRHKINCQYCHLTGEHDFIEGQHKEVCPKVSLPCPNKCRKNKTVLREDMEAHKNECPLEMIQCEYHSVGCKRVKIARKDMEKHKKQKMEQHLMMTKDELAGTKAQLATSLKQITNLTILLNAQLTKTTNSVDVRPVYLDAIATMFTLGNQACPVTMKMSEFNEKKSKDARWCSDSFYSYNKGYKMSLLVYPAGHGDGKGTHLSVYLYLMKGPHDDELTWPLRGEFEIKLLNQIRDNKHYSSEITFDDKLSNNIAGRVIEGDKATIGWGKPQFISNESLHKITTFQQLLKDDNLYFQINYKQLNTVVS